MNVVSAAPTTPTIRTGIIARYFEAKHYGFIRYSDGPGEVFFHALNMADGELDILPGQRVAFETQIFKGRWCAQLVRIVAQPQPLPNAASAHASLRSGGAL